LFRLIPTSKEITWLDVATSEILEQLQKQICSSTRKSVLLTGGHTAKNLYVHLLSEKLFSDYAVDFYFGDERCVPPDDPDSNFGMVMNTLFNSGIPDGCKVHRIIGEADDVVAEANRYASILPDAVDIILLSIGEDGHIASIFPHSDVINENFKLVREVIAPKPPLKRITITPKVLEVAKKTIVLACGAEKGKVIAEALKRPNCIEEYPILLLKNATVILNDEVRCRC
jgi:6-phosphogluconolactonase